MTADGKKSNDGVPDKYGVPIILYVDQTPWKILETLPIGSIVKTIKPETRLNYPTEYRLEISHYNVLPSTLPFWVNPKDGTVYLNESIQGRVS
jgi:hypothetical protein